MYANKECTLNRAITVFLILMEQVTSIIEDVIYFLANGGHNPRSSLFFHRDTPFD